MNELRKVGVYADLLGDPVHWLHCGRVLKQSTPRSTRLPTHRSPRPMLQLRQSKRI